MTTPSRITSRQNPRVQDVARLRSGRGRQRQGRFVIDGAREILRAIEAGIRCPEAFVCETFYEPTNSASVLRALRASGTELLPVTPEVFSKLCFGERDEIGIVVVAKTPSRRLDDLQLPSEPLIAVLERIEKPGNLGAVLRSADAAGVDAVIVADGRTDLFNPNTIRASLGTVFSARVVEATTAATLTWLAERSLQIVTARPDADAIYTSADLRGGVAIVLGSEAVGLSDSWRAAEVESVKLPMLGAADSLNVSTTAAVLFYEALRQRQ